MYPKLFGSGRVILALLYSIALHIYSIPTSLQCCRASCQYGPSVSQVQGHVARSVVTTSVSHNHNMLYIMLLDLILMFSVGTECHETVYLVNDEPQVYSFSFVETSCYSDGHTARVKVQPMTGTLQPHSKYEQLYTVTLHYGPL